jgi:hypothetical protein
MKLQIQTMNCICLLQKHFFKIQTLNESACYQKKFFEFRPWVNLVLENLSSNSGHESIRCNKIQKRDLVSSLPNNFWLLPPHPYYKNPVYTEVCKPECLVKASFHTVSSGTCRNHVCAGPVVPARMSCKSFIPHYQFWNQQKSRVCSTSCPSQNVLCFWFHTDNFQNQCRIMYQCASQNCPLVLNSAITFPEPA